MSEPSGLEIYDVRRFEGGAEIAADAKRGLSWQDATAHARVLMATHRATTESAVVVSRDGETVRQWGGRIDWVVTT